MHICPVCKLSFIIHTPDRYAAVRVWGPMNLPLCLRCSIKGGIRINLAKLK